MTEVAALAVFAFVSAVTPGPNNVMLLASGTRFGFRPTIPHLFGIVFGVASMALVVSLGIGTLVTTFPSVEIGLKVLGSAYLLYLAYQIAGSKVVGPAEVSKPLTARQAMAFQYVNPKAWVFVLAAITAFRPSGLPAPVSALLVAAVMMVVILPSAAIWAWSGQLLDRLMGDPQSRFVPAILGILLAATVAYIWV